VPAVPLTDLSLQHAEVADEVQTGFAEVFARGDFVGGRAVAAFESEFARFSEVTHCVGTGNGTDALEMALRALGVGPGHEVVLPANTFVATAEAVARAGARPVLVDVDDDTLLMRPDLAVQAVGPNTRAVIPVHLFGQAVEVEGLEPCTRDGRVAIVEDAAQAQGAGRFGVPVGGLGTIAGTSFYPGKNLGAYGDAGAVLTGDGELAGAVRMMRDHGSAVKHEHTILGFNSRLDTLQAVVLRAKLRRLAEWNARRREAADRYTALLAGSAAVRTPVTLPGNEHVWHLYVVRVPERDKVLEHLHGEGIFAGVHYPVPLHRQPAFTWLGYGPGDFPVAQAAAGQILSLPIYPQITAAQQERVVQALLTAVGESTAAPTT
jgi:dTDP-4-amino-4,6-dideoxygalactose transaminase